MSLAITIELGDADLQHFIDAMKRAQEESKHLSAQQVAEAASKLLVEGHKVAVPQFIGERLKKLDSMIAMVNDDGFALPDEDKQRVLACLTYFANPQDIIPDSVPVLGPLRDWQGIWCAFGHGHLGLTGSAPTGALIGAAIAGERPNFDFAPFSAERF